MSRRILVALVTLIAISGSADGQAILDTDRMLADLTWLADDAREGRRTGSEGAAASAAYLEAALSEAGVRPFGETYAHSFAIQGRDGDRSGTNVIGWIPGTLDRADTIVLTAHYDHLGVRRGEIYNGADDNASGSAGVVEMARLLAAEPLRHRVVVALLDGEEIGLRGAQAFVSDPPVDLASIKLNVNLDMVGRNEAGELYAAGTHHYPQLLPLLKPIQERAEVTLIFGHDGGEIGREDWSNASDHAAFHSRGIPFVYFGVEDHPDYHAPGDDSEDIAPDFYGAAVRTILQSLRALDRGMP
jgi:Zn-dependent M28 family amino/carboxypeptidase